MIEIAQKHLPPDEIKVLLENKQDETPLPSRKRTKRTKSNKAKKTGFFTFKNRMPKKSASTSSKKTKNENTLIQEEKVILEKSDSLPPVNLPPKIPAASMNLDFSSLPWEQQNDEMEFQPEYEPFPSPTSKKSSRTYTDTGITPKSVHDTLQTMGSKRKSFSYSRKRKIETRSSYRLQSKKIKYTETCLDNSERSPSPYQPDLEAPNIRNPLVLSLYLNNIVTWLLRYQEIRKSFVLLYFLSNG